MNTTLSALLLLQALAPAPPPLHTGGQFTVGVDQILIDSRFVAPPAFMFRYTPLGGEDQYGGVEVSFVMLPVDDFTIFAAEFGPSFTSQSRRAIVHGRLGFSLVMGVIPGAYIGGAVTIPIVEPVALRLDGTWRVYTGGTDVAGLGSVGIGLSFLPGRRLVTPPARPCDCAGGERP